MRKIVDIQLVELFKMICVFENGEKKIFDLDQSLDKSNKYAARVFNENVFSKAKVGSMGQIYWEGVAEITNLEGEKEPCEYDISPEFVYMNSSNSSL